MASQAVLPPGIEIKSNSEKVFNYTARGGSVARDRVLGIGDGLKTDMAGASDAGIDALFVPSGVHVTPGRGLDGSLLAELFAGSQRLPVAAISALRW